MNNKVINIKDHENKYKDLFFDTNFNDYNINFYKDKLILPYQYNCSGFVMSAQRYAIGISEYCDIFCNTYVSFLQQY